MHKPTIQKIAAGMFLFLSLFLNVDCIANELNIQKVFELVASRDSSVVHLEQNQRLYVAPERVTVNKDGIFLRTESQGLLKLPALLSGQQGCYAPVGNESVGIVNPVILCRSCQKPFNPNIFNKGVCPYCGTQN